ncbi:MAG TPA: CARDB domain-containing protein [Smithellaceae bacterium]|nr:CARDB domain-containing protein [Smithellaceae bacterium]HRS90363.1 CARDB domain-containing protein [Smithellaceae bacterium]HRV27091.1 CARDB domain-containing protein [Smithellaceae bacterium]
MKKAIMKKVAATGFILFIGCLFLFGGILQAKAQPLISAQLKAVPPSYSGSCPAKIEFEGFISVRNLTRPPLRLQYKFIRSDGASAPVQTLTFNRDGAQPVRTTWQLGGPGLPSYTGWQAIKVVYPQDLESNKANFSVSCQAAAQQKPDLVIRSFGLSDWGKCEPNNVIFSFQVTIANIGSAASPSLPGKALVQAMDQHGNGWGNGVPLPAIPPGGTHTATIPVYYLKGDPDHITGAAPHPFKAIADPLNLVDEQREDNNDSSNIINVDPRGICQQTERPPLRPMPLPRPLPRPEPQSQPQPLPQPLPQPQADVREDCISFNPATTDGKFINGDWKIVDGSHWMFSFGDKKEETNKALRIIKHYRMNQSCFVGRPDPSFQYMLVNSNAPTGSFPGEDCISFNPATTEVKLINGDWKIVDGSHWMFSFGNKESEARQALAIIKKYDFNRSCFVGRPGPSFKYLRR